MFDYASSSALLTTFYTTLGLLIALAVGTILGALASLMGLGYGVRHVKAWITGRKF